MYDVIHICYMGKLELTGKYEYFPELTMAHI